MATFTIDTFDNLTFNVPTADGTLIGIDVPPLDCIAPADIEAVNKKLAEMGKLTPVESVRVLLAHYAHTEAQQKAVAGLVARQITQIDEIWTKESGITVGESGDSTDSSSVEAAAD